MKLESQVQGRGGTRPYQDSGAVGRSLPEEAQNRKLGNTEHSKGFANPEPANAVVERLEYGDPAALLQAVVQAGFSSTQKRLPFPSSDSTPARPPSRSDIFRTMANPIPVPLYSAVPR